MYTTHYISIISYYSGYLVECLGENMNREGQIESNCQKSNILKRINFGQQAANFLPRISKDFDIGNSPSHIRIAMLIIFCD